MRQSVWIGLFCACSMSAACALDWDRYDPRRADGAAQQDAQSSQDGPGCGAAGAACCVNNSCATGLLCSSGTCMPCPAGQVVCSRSCVDTTSNDSHCGRCGNNCRSSQTCTNSMCR